MKSKRIPRQMIRLTCLLIFASALGTGCGSTKVLFVNSNEKNDIIRVGPKVEGRAYVFDGTDWILSKNKIKYPEGAFVGFLDEGEDEEE